MKFLKKQIKIIIDILMLVDLIYLSNRINGGGLLMHALLGIALFGLFILHHIFNAFWIKNLFKGKYNAHRTALCITNTLLCITMLLLMISSFMISGLVFNISFLPVRFVWTNIHNCSSSWIFILMAIHLSFHTNSTILKIERNIPQTVFYPLMALIIAAGGYAFSQSRIFSNLLLLYTDASLRYSNAIQNIFSVLTIAGICGIQGVARIIFQNIQSKQ